MSEQPVWVTGAGGLIGGYIVRHARTGQGNPPVIGLTRAELELTDFAAVRRAFRDARPQLIIHCAALSKSPACQENPALAHLLNVEVTALLAEIAAEIPFFFFSTDLVFDGTRGNYHESDAVNPLSVYGETKVAAERVVLANPRHTVIRTSLNAGVSVTGDRSFNEDMGRAWEAGRTLRLFVDEFRSPIPAAATARAVWELASRHQPGLYHLAGAERLSRWQIGRLLAKGKSPPPKFESCSLAEYRGAPRAPDTSLDCAKIQALLSFPLPKFSAWLAGHSNEL